VVIYTKNSLKIKSHLTQTETSLVMWLNVITISASPPFTRTHARRRPCH